MESVFQGQGQVYHHLGGGSVIAESFRQNYVQYQNVKVRGLKSFARGVTIFGDSDIGLLDACVFQEARQ